jgi:hypothetical protein
MKVPKAGGMPKSPWPIWLLTWALIIGFPVISSVWLDVWVDTWSEADRMHGDSVGIPMIGNIILTLLIAPLILALSSYCLRRYNPETTLLSWRPDKLRRSVVATCLLGGLAASWLVVGTLIAAAQATIWPDALFVIYCVLWALLALMWRAACITQHTRAEWGW